MDNGEENRLKQFRIHMNMTQQQMADLLKVGQNTYSRIENGVTSTGIVSHGKRVVAQNHYKSCTLKNKRQQTSCVSSLI